jgi:hypothetical protein
MTRSSEMRYLRDDAASVARAEKWREANGSAEDRQQGAPASTTPTLDQLLDLTPLDTAAGQAFDAEREAEEALRAAEVRDRERALRAETVTRERAQRFGMSS